MRFNRKHMLAVMLVILVWLTVLTKIVAGGSTKVEAEEPEVVTEYVYVEPEEEEITYGVYEKPQSVAEWIGNSNFVPMDCDLSLELQEYTYYMAHQYDIDYSLIMAVMWQESRYDVDAVSETGDYGLMQINENNHEWLTEALGLTDITVPEQNIEAGLYVLRLLYDKYDGNTSMVLMAYNMGEGNARKLWNDGIYESSYSRSILEKQEEIKDVCGM